MHQAKISVIIPCYNVEKYLDECIESVAKQTLKEIEVICVDDGSSDGTGDMLDALARKYCYLKVLHKQNGGLSKARNTGFDAASGKYVLFLDSDDFLIKENALESLYDKAVKENLDQLFYGTEVFFQNELVRAENLRYVEYYKYNIEYSDVYNGRDLFVMLSENSDFKVNACMQLFSRNFLLEHNLRFCEGIYHEDEVFTVQCISLAKRVSCLHEALYGRRIRENSIMTQKSKQKNVLGYCKGTEVLCEFAKENNFYVYTIFYEKYVKRLGILLELASRLFNNMDTEYQKEILKELDEEYRIWIEVGIQQRKRIDELLTEINVLKKEMSKKNSEYKVLFEAKRNIESSNSYKIGKKITWFPRILKKILFRKSRKIWLIGTPEFGNLGDHGISESEILFLKHVFPKCGARIQIVQVKMRIPYYKFYGTM